MSASPGPPARRAELHVLALIDHLAMGGAEMLLGHFAAAAPAAGIRLDVACLAEGDGNPAARSLIAAGVNPVNLNVPGRTGLRAYRAVRRHLAQLCPDLVHTHLGGSDFVGSLAGRSLGLPVVSTIHAMRWDPAPSQRARRLFYDLCFWRCGTRFIAVSESARAAFLAERHAVADRIVTIYNGIGAEPASGAGPAVRHELGIADDDLVLGMVSALRPEKGHDLAIAALAELRGTFPDLRLLIAGQGPMLAEIERLAAPHEGAIVLAGRRDDVMRVWDAVDICVQPSRADALPTTLIEAMAASVPIVASAVGGIPELVTDGRTGVLVPAPPTPSELAAAVGSLLRDSGRRHQLATAGRREYEQRFEPERWARDTRAYYDLIIADTSPTRRVDRCGGTHGYSSAL